MSSSTTADQAQASEAAPEPSPQVTIQFPCFNRVPLEPYLLQVRLAMLHNGWGKVAVHLALALSIALQVFADHPLDGQPDIMQMTEFHLARVWVGDKSPVPQEDGKTLGRFAELHIVSVPLLCTGGRRGTSVGHLSQGPGSAEAIAASSPRGTYLPDGSMEQGRACREYSNHQAIPTTASDCHQNGLQQRPRSSYGASHE